MFFFTNALALFVFAKCCLSDELFRLLYENIDLIPLLIFVLYL